MDISNDLKSSIEKIIFYEKTIGSPSGVNSYRMGYWLKKYIGLPDFIPIYVEMDHGVYLIDEPNQCQLKTRLPVFVTRERQKLELLKHSKQSHVMGSPFIHYRRLNKIEIYPDAKGTVCFPVHSTHLINVIFDWEKYAQDLLRLPPRLHPITVCLYWKDLLEKRYEFFLANNIPVVTAGHIADPNFTQNFYSILRNHQYSTSNQISSCAFYSIEMNIPFFLYGQSPMFNNFGGDHNRPLGNFDLNDVSDLKNLEQYFIFPYFDDIKITREIKNLCDEKLGLNDFIDRENLRKVIILALFRELNHNIFTVNILKVQSIGKKVLVHVAQSSVFLLNKFKKILKLMSFFGKMRRSFILKTYLYKYGLNQDNQIFTHLTLDEKILINQQVRKQEMKIGGEIICVEIGSFLGSSSCFICNALNNGSKLYCIDTWGNHAMRYCEQDKEEERDTYFEFKKNTNKYSNKIIEIRQWSTEAITTLKHYEQKIDFLFIDGDHNYEAVKKDWELYSTLLSTGSIVAFHDTGWAKGVKQVISEYVIPRAEKIAELPNIQFFMMRS